jgi:tripartite-type tricarboxylate transporter receptor subunit TctC
MKTKKRFLCFVMSVALFLALATTLNAAAPNYDYYKGKLVSYIVATKPGGGYDAYARLIGRYMQKNLPGATIVVKNVPGAGHILGANETYLAKPNGLTFGTFNTGLIYSQIIGMQGVKFDLAKFNFLGKATSEPRILVVTKKSPFKTMKEFMESKQMQKLGTSGAGSMAHNETLILMAAANAKNIKAIGGYPGKDLDMGILRGEIDGTIGSYDGLYDFIKTGEVRVLMQFTDRKFKDLQDVPTTKELNVPEKGKKLLSIVANIGQIGRLSAAPPGVPEDRLAALREAYKKALTDPALIAEGKKVGFDLDPLFGDDVLKLVKAALHQPPENIALLKEIIKIQE